MSARKVPKWARAHQPEPWSEFELATSGTPTVAGVSKDATYINRLYQVGVQEFDSGWTWLSIVRRDRSATHDWRHLQRIKNELCGPEREAVELYPAESRLVDTNNQYHLWVAPEGATLPLGYTHREVSDNPPGAHKQRPFDEAPADLNMPTDGPITSMLIPQDPRQSEL